MNLNKDNYYSQEANEHYMSASQYKDFCKCPACAIAKIKGEYVQEETEALFVGKYLDAYCDGELDNFIAEHSDKIYQKNGKKYAYILKADKAISVIEDDTVLKDLLTNGERQVIMTGKIQGVDVKIMIDCLHKDKIVDGKYMRDFADVWNGVEKVPFWRNWGYDVQAALYVEIYEQNTLEKLPFELACVSKEEEPDKFWGRFTDKTLNETLEEIKANIVLFDDMKKGNAEIYGCGKCDYCKSLKKLSESDRREL